MRREKRTTRPTGNVRPARLLRVDCLSLVALFFAEAIVVLFRPLIVIVYCRSMDEFISE